MNDTELASLERSMREILTEARLQWILDQVDASIEAGVSEQATISFRPYEFELFDRVSNSGGRRKRSMAVSKNRPYSAAERLNLLLTALERAATELPELHEAFIKTLAREVGDDPAPAQTTVFLPDEDATHAIPPSPLEEVMSEDRRAGRSRLLEIISQLREVAAA